MYALQSNSEAYATKPEVKWQRNEFEESVFSALESEQKNAFVEMVFEPGSDGAAPLRTPVAIKTDGPREEGMVTMVYPVSPGCKPQ